MKSNRGQSGSSTSLFDNFQTPMRELHTGSGDRQANPHLDSSSFVSKHLPPLRRRRHSMGAQPKPAPNEVATCSSPHEQDMVRWFHGKISNKIWKGAAFSALVGTLIMVLTLFLAKLSFYSPIYSLIAVLSPLLHPLKLILALILFFTGNVANSYALALLYQKDNFYPTLPSDQPLFSTALKLRGAVVLAITVVNSLLTCFIWVSFVKHGEFDRSMCGSILVGALVTSAFIVFYRKKYTLVFRKLKAPIITKSRIQDVGREIYVYLSSQEIFTLYRSAWQSSLFAQVAQNVGIWFFECLPFSFSDDLDAQFHFLLFNFMHILIGFYIHEFIYDFMLEPIIFNFPVKYEVADPSFEQKANMRNVLRCSDDFFKMYALYDLVCLSTENSSFRRELVFELSIPGNNPLNWNAVRNACLTQITRLTAELEGARQRLGVALCGTLTDEEDSFNQSMLMMNPVQRMQMYSKTVRRRQHAALRRKSAPVVNQHAVIEKTHISPYMARNVIMGIEALVNLIICSLKEDRFGIVQKDRPVILRSILNLSAVIDKYSREKKAISSDDGIDSSWILEVENAISRSVTAFDSTFKNYIDSFGLSPEEHRIYSQIVFRRIYEKSDQ